MNDKQIYAGLITVIDEGLKANAINNVCVLRGYQPLPQGRLSKPSITLVKLFDRRIGHPHKSNIYDKDNDVFEHQEITLLESTFQISAFLTENPADEAGLTASDLCNTVARILSHDDALVALAKIGLRPVSFSPIRQNQFENEKGVYELNPSFDLVLTHQFVTKTVIPAAQTLEGKFA